MGVVAATVGGAVVSSVVGNALAGSGGGGGGAQAQQSFTNPFKIKGDSLFAGSGMNKKGNVRFKMGDELKSINDIGGQQATLFGQQAMDDPGALQQRQLGGQMLNQLGTDPRVMQQQLFQQQAAMLQGGFDQQNLNLEGRLFSQGRLGSTGGALQQSGQLDSQNTAFGQLLANSFQQSQQQQAQTARLGQGLMSGGVGLQGQLQQLGQGGLNTQLGIQEAQNATLQTAGNLNRRGEGAVAASPSGLNLIGQGMMAGGAQALGDGINTLFTPAASTPGVGVMNATQMGTGVSPSATVNSTF